MKKFFLTLFAVTGIMLTSCQKQEEHEKEKEKTKQGEIEKEETKLPKLPVRITSEVEGTHNIFPKEVLFFYDEKGKVTKVQELDIMKDAFFQEYNISYEKDKLKKVEFWSSGPTTEFKSIKEFLEDGRYKVRQRFKTIVYNDSGAQVIEKENNGSEQKTDVSFTFNDGKGRITSQNGVSIIRDDKGNITYAEGSANFHKYDDKNHPFKNINIYLGHHFFDVDLVTGWNKSETNILPLPISSSISYVNNFIEANLSGMNISRTLKYDIDNYPIEIKTNYGGGVVTYKIEYNK